MKLALKLVVIALAFCGWQCCTVAAEEVIDYVDGDPTEPGKWYTPSGIPVNPLPGQEMGDTSGLIYHRFVKRPPNASAAQPAQGGDRIEKTLTLTGNHPGGFNIDAKVNGDKQKVPMEKRQESERYADMGPMDGGSPSASASPAPPQTPDVDATVNQIFGTLDKDGNGVISPEEVSKASAQPGNTPAEQKMIDNLMGHGTDLGYSPADVRNLLAPPDYDSSVPGTAYRPSFPAPRPPQPGPSPAGGLAGQLINQVKQAADAMKKPLSDSSNNKPKDKKDDKDYPGKGKLQKPLQDAADKILK